MKKMLILLSAVLLCTGCQSKQNETASQPSDTSSAESTVTSAVTSSATSASTAETLPEDTGEATETSSATAEPTAEIQSEYLFLPGVWRGEDSYFFFHEDGSGQLLNFEYGIGVGFQMEPFTGDSVTFHMGAADNNTVFGVSDVTGESVTLTTDDGTNDTLVYVCEGDSETFSFYSNEEAQTLALSFYQAQTGYTPQYAAVQNNADGTLTIQLYDEVDGHNSTSAWYTVDRVTLVGTDDMTGETVDLKTAADSVAVG
ncbi:MAG: hypothetical protein SPD47_03685 [Oscillospiraceae bacterium]|nr:hypothetical protein [Oscillospiraceae bacterium]